MKRSDPYLSFVVSTEKIHYKCDACLMMLSIFLYISISILPCSAISLTPSLPCEVTNMIRDPASASRVYATSLLLSEKAC